MIRLFLFEFFVLWSIHGAASTTEPAPCDGAAFRQFDFWLGEWEVRKPDGTLAGTNQIEREYGGCVLRERYVTPGGYRGESLNMYDASRTLWHQTWVDNSGLLLLLEGRLVDGQMVLQGLGQGRSGGPVEHRITWTPNPDGSVRQLWESTDSSGTWTVAFDGQYTRTGSR